MTDYSDLGPGTNAAASINNDSSSREAKADRLNELDELLWATIPTRLVTRFPRLRGVAADGHALLAFPGAASAALIFVTIVGVLVGTFGLGFTDVYTESLTLIGAAACIGAFSGQLGAAFVVSFAASDFFLQHRSWSLRTVYGGAELFRSGLLGNLGRIRVPLLISYALLWMVVVAVPRLPRVILSGVARARLLPPVFAFVISTGLICALTYFLVGIWTDFTPMLIRPVFTWRSPDSNPSTIAIFPLQRQGQTIQRWALAGCLLRQTLLAVMLFVPAIGTRLRNVEITKKYRESADPKPKATGSSKGRRVAAGVGAAIISTALLAGILERLWLWWLTFGVMLVVHLVRSGVFFGGLLRPLQRFMANKPLALRLAAGWVVSQIVGQAIVSPNSYADLTIASLVGVVLMVVLFPGVPTEPVAARQKSDPASKSQDSGEPS
jgi:hypothetical protein